jgi:hypothetical protein
MFICLYYCNCTFYVKSSFPCIPHPWFLYCTVYLHLYFLQPCITVSFLLASWNPWQLKYFTCLVLILAILHRTSSPFSATPTPYLCSFAFLLHIFASVYSCILIFVNYPDLATAGCWYIFPPSILTLSHQFACAHAHISQLYHLFSGIPSFSSQHILIFA